MCRRRYEYSLKKCQQAEKDLSEQADRAHLTDIKYYIYLGWRPHLPPMPHMRTRFN